MIKHIVFVRIKGASEEEKLAALNKLKAAMDNLPSLIPEIKKYDSGLNFSDADSASDAALVSEFESKADLEAYKAHPELHKLLGLVSSLKGRTSIVDFEF